MPIRAAAVRNLGSEWRALGWLRQDLSLDELALRAAAIGSVELWDRVVRVAGESPAAYQQLIAGLLLDTLTAPAADEFAGRAESQ